MEKEKQLRSLLGEDYEDFVAFRNMKWVGPFTINKLLNSCLDDAHPWPPESNGVYLVSRKAWKIRPNWDCIPLYVGSNTGRSSGLCTRVGDLIADMFGFFWHSSGGQSLYNYCKEKKLNPKRLYIGWVENCGCFRCAENYIYDLLKPELNRRRPAKCKQHHGKTGLVGSL